MEASKPPSPPPPPPVDYHQMPTESAVKRYKFLWRAFLIFNFALGAYMFTQPGKKERVKEKSEAPTEVVPVPATTVSSPPPKEEEKPELILPPITRPVIVRQPLPDDQQREIFKWMLEEKRKLKPLNRNEKKRVDQEKAILKEFIRSETIPRI